MNTVEYAFGDVVYLATDPDQLPRIVKKILIEPTGISYLLGSGELESWHYQFEITKTKDVIIATGGESKF